MVRAVMTLLRWLVLSAIVQLLVTWVFLHYWFPELLQRAAAG